MCKLTHTHTHTQWLGSYKGSDGAHVRAMEQWQLYFQYCEGIHDTLRPPGAKETHAHADDPKMSDVKKIERDDDGECKMERREKMCSWNILGTPLSLKYTCMHIFILKHTFVG